MKTEFEKRTPMFDALRSRIHPGVRAMGAALLLSSLCSGTAAVTLTTITGGPYQGNKNAPGFTDGNTFLTAQFHTPSALAFDGSGTTLFVADRDNNAIRKITEVGNNSTSQTITFLGAEHGISAPIAVAIDGEDNLYILNSGNGSISQFDRFGNYMADRAVGLVNPMAIALDGSTNIYVTVDGNTVLRVGAISTTTVGVIGTPGTFLQGITVLDSGMLALTDAGNHGIWLMNPANGAATALTGFHGVGDVFGNAANAKFNSPAMIAKAGNGMLVVSDNGNHRVKVVSPSGVVTNLYGVASSFWYTGEGSYPGWWDGTVCSVDALGCPEARSPVGVAVAPNGDVFATETFYHLIRRASGTSLTGPNGGGGGTNVTVVAPTISPNSGYYPMGRLITVNSPNPNVFYTVDGSEPTTNSARVTMNGNTGTLRWINSTNDLTGLRVKAFVGTNSSVTVSGVPVSANSVAVPPGLSSSLVAGIGSRVVVPVVANLRTNNQVRSYQFRVEITPNGGAPMISDQFDALNVTSNEFVSVVTSAQGGSTAVFSVQKYAIGTTRGLVISAVGTNANVFFQRFAAVAMLAIPIPGNAPHGSTYTLNVLNSSATSDGVQTPVSFPPGPAATVLITNVLYTVGDSAPGAWYNAGDFGNTDIDNSDVNNAFYAASGLRLPYSFSDVYNAMDAYPDDEPGFVGGDGEIRFLDWQVIQQRSLRLPPYYNGTNNWMRAWATGGDRTNLIFVLPSGLPDGGGEVVVGSPWNRQAKVGALPVGNVAPAAQVNVPIYVRTAYGATLSGLQFRCIITPDNGGPAIAVTPAFVAAAGITAPIQQSFKPGELACGWSLGSFNFAANSSNYLGTLRFHVPAAALSGNTYSVSFANADGSPNLQTQYQFETKRAIVTVLAPSVPANDITSDDWKVNFFGAINAVDADPNADPDHDGVPNWAEYVAGTSPADALSKLKFDSASARVVSGQRRMVLNWLSAPGKMYEVLGSSGLGGGWGVLGTISGDGNTAEFTDLNPPGSRFYKLRVLP